MLFLALLEAALYVSNPLAPRDKTTIKRPCFDGRIVRKCDLNYGHLSMKWENTYLLELSSNEYPVALPNIARKRFTTAIIVTDWNSMRGGDKQLGGISAQLDQLLGADWVATHPKHFSWRTFFVQNLIVYV